MSISVCMNEIELDVILQVKWNRCEKVMNKHLNYLVKGHHLCRERAIKGPGMLILFCMGST